MWFGTNGGGASRFDGQTFQTLTREDGLTGNVVYAIYQDAEGAMWFGASGGATRYGRPASSLPPAVFVDAVVADRRYEGAQEVSAPDVVKVIAFEFHGMSVKTRPDGMVYRYRLRGHEAEWRTTRARRVEYGDLPVGDYVFEVVAVDRDLVYSESPATVRLHVVRDARDAQIDELERRVRERTRELQEANAALSSANRELFALNRSLVVEAALERVRGRALAMQQPEDIASVVEMLFAEFHNLGFAPWRSAIRIHDEDSGVRRIWGFQDGKLTRAEAPLARFDNNPLSREIEEARRRGSPWFTVKREGPEIRELFERIKNTVGHSEGFVEEALRKCPDPLFLHFIFYSQGSRSILSGRPMTEVELVEAKRFADAFDFAYTRFLDLQAAEQRAREAQVEAALERVRVAALGMKSSGDLGQAGTAVFQQLRELGISILRGGFAIINETSGQPVWEFWGLTGEGVIIRGVEIPIAVHPRFEGIYGAWKRGDEIHQYEVEGDELKDYIGALQRTGYPAQLPENWTSYCACAMVFSHGFLYAISRERLPDSDAAVLGRFRDVFTFAYTRFLDIQKAEAQAKSAARQAAVDRVRAEIATMRTSADLEGVTPLIWKELTGLGVPFVRCGVFILDEETTRARLYLTNPRGASLAALDLPFGSHPYIEAITDHWREQKVYTDRWDRQAFEAWMAFLQTQGYAVQPERYQDGAAPPESLVLG